MNVGCSAAPDPGPTAAAARVGPGAPPAETLEPATNRAELVARLRTAGCVFAEDEAELLLSAAGSTAELARLAGRRVAGAPLEHVLGWVEFFGLRLAVAEGVFVPRRRTELLVLEAIALAAAPGRAPDVVVIDLCCGSGAVGAALAAALPGIELHLVDIEPAAVACALRNMPVGGRVHLGDLYEPLPAALRGRVDLVTVNAPYVPTGAISTMPPEARLHEPRVALDGGPDGLAVQRRVARSAREWLAPGGCLLIETGEHQAPQTAELLRRAGLVTRVARSDELDATVVVGRRPAAGS